jgi:hypothetical protein
MGKYDPKTGALVDPNAPVKPSTVGDAVQEEIEEVNHKVAAKEAAKAAANAPQPEKPQFTTSDLMALLNEIRKPNEYEQFQLQEGQKKLKEESDKRLNLAMRARQNAELNERIQQQQQLGCTHMKDNSTTAFAGQVNSDGYWKPLCIRCGKVLPKVKAPDAWKTGGINTQMGADVAGVMRFLNEQTLLAWHRSTVPNCQEACCAHLRKAQQPTGDGSNQNAAQLAV